MATLAPPRDLTATFESALARATGQSVLRVRRAVRGMTAASFASDWEAAAPQIVRAIEDGQAAATALSVWYMQESIRTTLHVPSPLPQPRRIVGQMPNGQTVARYVARTPDVVNVRISGGMKADDAIDMSIRRLASSAATEPFRLGRAIVADVAVTDGNYSGWERIAEGDACDFCEMLATRGDAYTSKASAELTSRDLAFHNNCRCYAEPVLAADAPAVRAFGEQQWADTENRPTVYRTGARSSGRRRAPSPSSAASQRATANYRPGARTPERAASVRLQIDQLEERIQAMTARRAAGDVSSAPALEWSRARLRELRAELATFA